MHARRQRHLDDEADDRRIEDDVGDERGPRVLERNQLAGGHVQLLLNDAGADRGEGDDERDDLQVTRLQQQAQSFQSADLHALFALLLRRVRGVARLLARDDGPHDEEAEDEEGRADQQQVLGPDGLGELARHARADDAAEARAAADESERPFGLPGLGDVVGECPELTDQQAAGQEPPEVVRDRDPALPRLEQDPESNEEPRHRQLRDREHPAARQQQHDSRVALNHEAHQQAGGQLHVRQVVRAQVVDELRPRGGLEDVVPAHREERVREHQKSGDRLFVAQFNDGREQAPKSGRVHRVGTRGFSFSNDRRRVTSPRAIGWAVYPNPCRLTS